MSALHRTLNWLLGPSENTHHLSGDCMPPFTCVKVACKLCVLPSEENLPWPAACISSTGSPAGNVFGPWSFAQSIWRIPCERWPQQLPTTLDNNSESSKTQLLGCLLERPHNLQAKLVVLSFFAWTSVLAFSTECCNWSIIFTFLSLSFHSKTLQGKDQVWFP